MTFSFRFSVFAKYSQFRRDVLFPWMSMLSLVVLAGAIAYLLTKSPYLILFQWDSRLITIWFILYALY